MRTFVITYYSPYTGDEYVWECQAYSANQAELLFELQFNGCVMIGEPEEACAIAWRQ